MTTYPKLISDRELGYKAPEVAYVFAGTKEFPTTIVSLEVWKAATTQEALVTDPTAVPTGPTLRVCHKHVFGINPRQLGRVIFCGAGADLIPSVGGVCSLLAAWEAVLARAVGTAVVPVWRVLLDVE